jgi:inner membrane protein
MSHLALDALNNYGVRPFLPFSSARYYADLVFIVDPLLWLLLGGMAVLAGRRTLRGHLTWILIAAAVTWFLYTQPRTPDELKRYWPFALLFVIALRAVGVGRQRARAVLVAGSCLLAIYLAGLEISARLAWRNALRVQPPPSLGIGAFIDEPWQLVMRSPVVASPLRWSFFLQGERWYYVRDVDISGRVVGFRRIGPRNLDDPRVGEAMSRPEAYAWRYFARLPWAWSEEQSGHTLVGLTDARYQWERGPSWCSIEVELPPAANLGSGAFAPR